MKIVDDLMSNILSDLLSNNEYLALAKIKDFLKTKPDKNAIDTFRNDFFKNNFHSCPDLFNITMLLLSDHSGMAIFILNQILNYYPSTFTLQQLYVAYTVLKTHTKIINHDVLLVLFLLKDYQKLLFYIDIGFDPEKVLCKHTYVNLGRFKSNKDDTIHKIKRLDPHKNYLGQKLAYVLKLENIEY